ncbi:acyltransferase family protein, partial [Barnesiella intestinihominis]|uniref:acyltransferase family protein n=1 Tax=Barnesiella intestinihominis TaxID=487174 RepID=UPI003AAB69C4
MGKIRDITFDIAKGIGIVLVVIGHYIPDTAPSWYIGFVSFVYHFHMPLFFMIAGFFYERSIKKVGYWRFVRSKFERLMFPYFILSWTIIGIKILVDGFMQVDHPVSIRAFYRVFYLP